jgi:WD40 repeat protein
MIKILLSFFLALLIFTECKAQTGYRLISDDTLTVYDLAYSSRNENFAAITRQFIYIFDADTQLQLHHEKLPSKRLTSIDAHPSGNFYLVGSLQGELYAYYPDSMKYEILVKHPSPVTLAKSSPDGFSIAVASLNGTISKYNYPQPGKSQKLNNTGKLVTDLVFTQNGQLVIGSSGNKVTIWDWENYKVKSSFLDPNNWIRDLDLFGDSILSTAGDNDFIVYYDLTDPVGKSILHLEGRHNNWIVSSCRHPKGNFMVTAGHDNTLIIRDLPAKPGSILPDLNKPSRQFRLYPEVGSDYLQKLVFAPDGSGFLVATLGKGIYYVKYTQEKETALIKE